MAKLALFPYFVNSRKKIHFLCKLQLNTIVNKLPFLYKIFNLCCMDVWALLGHVTHVWVSWYDTHRFFAG